MSGPNKTPFSPIDTTDPTWFVTARTPLQEINRRLLDLMALASRETPSVHLPLAGQLRDIFGGMDSAALNRASSCPYLLVDAGFQDAARWSQAVVEREPDSAPIHVFPHKDALELAHMTLTLAWSLVRSHREAASLLLGLPPACSGFIADLRLQELQRIATNHGDWIRPRWERRPEVWRRLLSTAEAPDESMLDNPGLKGLHLFFGDLVP